MICYTPCQLQQHGHQHPGSSHRWYSCQLSVLWILWLIGVYPIQYVFYSCEQSFVFRAECVLWGCTMLVKASHAHSLNMDLMGCSHKYVPLSLFNLWLIFSTHFSISSQNPCPEASAGFLSTITFWWFTRWVHAALCCGADTHFVVSMSIWFCN